MSGNAPARGLILSLARDDAYVPLARAILAKMGYPIVTEEERASLPPELGERYPDLRIADDERLADLASDPSPVIVIAGRDPLRLDDPRILGAVRRPAGVHELYRLIQQALEGAPRSAPRVPTDLSARCRIDGEQREWPAALLSLSENGCLLRSTEPLPLGSRLDVRFELPGSGWVETGAEASYRLVRDLGLVFDRTPAASRHAIAAFVERLLAATLEGAPLTSHP